MADADTRATAQELNYARPSTLDRVAMFRVLKSYFRDDSSHSAKWRIDTKEAFDFRAGHQWTADEKSQLKEQMRPEIVFNRSLTIIKAVAGFEINSRHEIQFLPRKMEDTAVNEVLTGASKWMGDECEAEDEESEAFQDLVTCGMGFTENRVSYELDSSGLYEEVEVDPIEMYWHCKARKRNLVDAKRMARLREMPLSDAQEMFPGFTKDQLDARWAVGFEPEEQTKTLEEKRIRDENAGGDNYTEKDDVHILQMQWIERVPYWLVADEATNKKIELPDDQYQKLKSRMEMLGMKLVAVKIFKRQYFQAFIGAEILESGDAPIPTQFSWQCMTGEADKNKGTWFGLIRVMQDPQKWANKWLSQTLHIMNANAKGGILAEADAFDDQRQAEESYARPEAITWMKKGALGNAAQGPKWAAKPQATFPSGFINLLEFAISSLRDVTGINLELLGQQDINQPGILEAQRKQAGMTVLATMFDSLRRFRKRVGLTRLYFIQEYLSDGRLVRISGQDGAKVIPLIRDKCLGEYDVVVDDAPTSPNQKQANWALIAPMLPMFKDQLMNNPELLLEILQFSPLPSRLIEAVRVVLAKPNPQAAQQQQIQQLGVAKIVAGINKDQSTAEMQNAKAGATQSTSMYDLAMARHLLQKTGMEGNDPLDTAERLAKISKDQATTDNIRAKTAGEHAGTMNTHMDTAHKGVSALIDALSPLPGSQSPQTANAA